MGRLPIPMGEPVTYASCALFGFRPDRDTGQYYRLLLNDLAAKRGESRLVVATNEPMGFDSSIELVEVSNIHTYRRRLWDIDSVDEDVKRRLATHPRNLTMAQYKYPWMVGVYLAKTAIMLELAEQLGKVVWLDAGLLFSLYFQHVVPKEWFGYDAERLAGQTQPLAQQYGYYGVCFKRRWRPFKNRRPHFHGLSYVDMGELARRAGTEPDEWYSAAGAMILDADHARTISAEFPEVWKLMLDMDRCGTEENVLSVLRWRHKWKADPYVDWVPRFASVPEGYSLD